MPRETVKIIIDMVFNKPINLRPGYDLDYVRNYRAISGGYGYNRFAKMIEIERRYDDLSIIRPHETPQQWADRIRAPLQELLSRREYSIYHAYCLFASFGQGVTKMYDEDETGEIRVIPHEYRRPSVHKSQMAICFKCWKLVKITEVKPRKVYYNGWGRWAYEVKPEDLMKEHWSSISHANRLRIRNKPRSLIPPPLPPKPFT